MRTWREIAARAGRNDKPGLLALAALVHEDLDPEDLPEAIRDAWTGAEWPLRMLEDSIWVSLFHEALLDPDEVYLFESEVRPKDELPERITLYRGALPGLRYGMSWTDDRDRAVWFAYRFGESEKGPRVYQQNTPRDIVLARYNKSRGEGEWVLDHEFIDPDDVTEVG